MSKKEEVKINDIQPGEVPSGQQKSWINPIGGLGDTLMLSGVLKQVHDREPDKQFNLVRRSGYMSLLKGHPAIRHIGHPPADARLIRTEISRRG